jgi:hypothetical protein
MENQKLRSGGIEPSKEQRRVRVSPLARRDSVLILALMAMLVGGVVIGLLSDMMIRFSHISAQQVKVYSDHVIASSYLENAKGLISQFMRDRQYAPHPKAANLWGDPDVKIRSTEDLLVRLDMTNPNDPLSVDQVAEGRRVVINVYDLTYTMDKLANDIPDAELARFPSPLALIPKWALMGEKEFETVSRVETEDIKYTERTTPVRTVDLTQVGAYLIRVELFEPGKSAPVRKIEEAFYQLVSRERLLTYSPR